MITVETIKRIQDKRTRAYNKAKAAMVKRIVEIAKALKGEAFDTTLWSSGLRDVVDGGMFTTYYTEFDQILFDGECLVKQTRTTHNGANRELPIEDAYVSSGTLEEITEEWLNKLNYSDFIYWAEAIEDAISEAKNKIDGQAKMLENLT